MREEIKKLSEFLIFVSVVSIPFIIATNTLGFDTFLDSFENPDAYLSIRNSDTISGITTEQEKYIIVQKINHPDFEIQEEDTILYFSFDGELFCNKIYEINGVGTFKRYYISEENESLVFNSQIVGKVIKVLDENLLTDISLNIWDISISKLNIESIL